MASLITLGADGNRDGNGTKRQPLPTTALNLSG